MAIARKRKKLKEGMVMATLDTVPLGRRVTLKALYTPEPLKTRLMDLGFVPGTEVEVLFAAPSGSPRAYGLLHTVIALRQQDAAQLEVEPL